MPKPEEIRSLIEELRGTGGVGHGVESLEVFLLFPDEFRRRYAELVGKALRGALEGSIGSGRERDAELGKAQVKSGTKGRMVGAGAGGGGKRYKNFWVVRDENALRVKLRIDRRLRALARDITAEMGAPMRGDARTSDGTYGSEGKGEARGCAGCGRFTVVEWVYCPTCGYELKAVWSTGEGEG